MYKHTDIDNYCDKNILFTNRDYKEAKRQVKEHLINLSKNNEKIILLDSFWSKYKYNRFMNSKYKKQIERKYHIKMSVQDFLKEENILYFMNERKLNIIKVKSILGYMSAAELFPVLISKINDDFKEEQVHILINDFILDSLTKEEMKTILNEINFHNIRLVIMTNKPDIPVELLNNVDIIKS